MADVSIRDLTLQEANLAGEFFHRWWRPDHVFYRDPALLKWMYHDSPLARNHSEGLTFKVAFRNDEMVGVFAYVPFPLNRQGRRSAGVHLSAWWVHPDHRRGSVGVQLLNSLQHRMGFDACVSGINTPIAETLYGRMGWVVCQCIPRWVLPLAEGRFRGLLGPSADDGLRLERLSADAGVAEADVSVRSLVRMSDLGPLGWDDVFWETLAPRYVGPARELAYLCWRYQDIPIFTYEAAVAVSRGNAVGLVVYRFEHLRDSGDTIVRIVDLVSESAAMQPLVQHVVAHARSRDAVMIDCFSTHVMHGHALRHAGFVSALDDSGQAYWAPHLFQPVDHERRRLNAAWWIRDTDLTQPAARNDFLLMKGDYEFDRPN